MHDKLLTARLFRRSGIPHPSTLHVRPDRPFPAVRTPVVVKPRFGSWGREVRLCDDAVSLHLTLGGLQETGWYERQGVLVQELVLPQGYDLRILVAGERAVGAIFRVAAADEWRTNISLGGVRRPVPELPREACTIALAAARASGAALVGVDLLPNAQGGWTVVELNGAVEFTHEYAASGDVFADVALELARAAVDGPTGVDWLTTAAA
jgi:[lysine-biosynthesis-protein LysW]---L-2-aminoadipate ligase